MKLSNYFFIAAGLVLAADLAAGMNFGGTESIARTDTSGNTYQVPKWFDMSLGEGGINLDTVGGIPLWAILAASGGALKFALGK